MSQNTSHAVMSQRVEPRDSLDFFPTPLWATRALCEWLKERGYINETSQAWEPACGQGHMARALREYFPNVYASDVYDYGFGRVEDFLTLEPVRERSPWIITNPPFRLGEEFAHKALWSSTLGVAFLVRTAFLESVSRYENLFSVSPPTDVLQFSERVPMFKGRVDPTGSTATSYCWVVWRKIALHEFKTHLHWIAPCRKRLERAGDYADCSLSSPVTESRQ